MRKRENVIGKQTATKKKFLTSKKKARPIRSTQIAYCKIRLQVTVFTHFVFVVAGFFLYIFHKDEFNKIPVNSKKNLQSQEK